MIKINKLLFAVATVLPTITCLSVSVENVQASSNVNQGSIKALLDTATKKNIDIAENSYRKQGLLPRSKNYWAKDNSWQNSIEALHELTILGTNPESNVFNEKINIFKQAITDAVSKNDKTKAGAYLNGMTIYTFLYQFINNQYNVKPQSGNKTNLNDFEQIFNGVINGVEETFKQSLEYDRLAKLIIGQSDEGKTQLKDMLLHDMRCYLLQFGYVAPIDDENNKKVSSVLSEVLKDKSVSSENKGDKIIHSMKNELSKSVNKHNKINHMKKKDLSKSVKKNLEQEKKISSLKEDKKIYIEDLNVEMENKKNSKPNVNLNFVTPNPLDNIASIESDRNHKDSSDNIFTPQPTINKNKKNNKIINKKKNEIKNNINDNINNINLVYKPTINDENQNKNNINNIVDESKVKNNDKKNDDDIFSLFNDVAQGNTDVAGVDADGAPLPTLIDIENQTGLRYIGLTIKTKKIGNRDANYLDFVDGENSEFKNDPLIKNLVNGFNAISDNPVLRHGGLSGAENSSQLTALFHALALQSNLVQSIILNYLDKYKIIQKSINSKFVQTKNYAILTKDVVELLAKMWILPKDYEDTSRFSENSVNDLLASYNKTFVNESDIDPNGLFNKIVEVLNSVLETKKDDEKLLGTVNEFVKDSGIKNITEHEKKDLKNFLQTCNSGVSDNMNFLTETLSVCTGCANSSSGQTISDSININLRDYQGMQTVHNGVVSLNSILQNQYGLSVMGLVQKCSNCKEDLPQRNTTKLKFLPQNLVVKFRENNNQSNVNVSIPEFLDLKNDFGQKNPIIDEQINNENNTKYFLSAFVFWDDEKHKYITLGKSGPQSGWVCYDGKVTDNNNGTLNKIRKFGLKDGSLFKPQMAIYNKIKGQNVSEIYDQIGQSYKNWDNDITNKQQTCIQEKSKSVVNTDSKSIKDTKANHERDYPLGLINPGQSCYMNSTLQCFWNILRFRKYILNNANDILNGSVKQIEGNDYTFFKEFVSLLKSVWSQNGSESSQNVADPNSFYDILCIRNPLFHKKQAGDSKDFITYMLETIHKILKVPSKNWSELENLELYNQYDKKNSFSHFFKDFNAETSVISDLFFQISETVTLCQNPACTGFLQKMPCYNFQIVNILITPLNEVYNHTKVLAGCGNCLGLNPTYRQNLLSQNKVTLYDCLDFNQKQEFFTEDNSIYCNLCKTQSNALYQTRIYSEPNVLIINLNRGRNNVFPQTLDTYPKNINITNFVWNDLNITKYRNFGIVNPDLEYELVGVVRHIGESSAEGHFISDIKVGNQWFKANDSFVTKYEDSYVNCSDNTNFDNFGSPYLLFYVKKSILNKGK